MADTIMTIFNFAKPFLIAYGVYAGIVTLFALAIIIMAILSIFKH